MNLCTLLPDLPPADGAERITFSNAIRQDWCHDHDMDDLHQVFQADGIPYTVQHRPAAPEPESFNDPDPGHDLLTPWARNSSLR